MLATETLTSGIAVALRGGAEDQDKRYVAPAPSATNNMPPQIAASRRGRPTGSREEAVSIILTMDSGSTDVRKRALVERTGLRGQLQACKQQFVARRRQAVNGLVVVLLRV